MSEIVVLSIAIMKSGLLLTISLLLAVVGIFAAAAVTSRNRKAAWQAAASQLGFYFDAGGWFSGQRLVGKLDGISVEAAIISEGAGKSRTEYTTVSAQIRGAVPLGMRIYHEGLFQKLGRLFGGQDIQVGDESLDRNFVIQGSDPPAIRQLVCEPGVKRALLVCHQHCNSLRVEDNEARLKEYGGARSAEKLVSYIRLCVDVALAIQAATAPVDQLAPPFDATPSAQPRTPAKPASADSNDWW